MIVVPTALCDAVGENKQLEIAKAVFQNPLPTMINYMYTGIDAHIQVAVVRLYKCVTSLRLRGDFSNGPSTMYVIIIHGSLSH